MIAEPLNDTPCLAKITEQAVLSTDTDAVRELAARFATPPQLAAWIRSLPQRDDNAEPDDGPKVDCDVPQRLRLPADDPNCVERAALYVSAAEILDPDAVRCLATIDTPIGRHTFPVEDDVPVNLDPRIPRNALKAGLFRMHGASRALRNLPPERTLGFILDLAAEPARSAPGGVRRVRNARRAMEAAINRRPLPRNGAADVGFALALAERAADAFGPRGAELVRLGSMALRHVLSAPVPRNLIGLRIGGRTIRPDLRVLRRIGRVAGRLGVKVGAEVVRGKLAGLGLGPEVIGAIEDELRVEGLTLGALAEPAPPPGTLASLTTHALLQQRVADKLT